MFNKETADFLRENYGISDRVLKMAETAEEELKERFAEADKITEYNQYKVSNSVMSTLREQQATDIMTWAGKSLKIYMRMYSMPSPDL